MRYFLEIAYQGTAYHGWQIQANAHTVQEEIENAFSLVMRQPISLMGSGRTDTGVHAMQQFAHFDSDTELDTEHLHYRLNAILPDDLAIRHIFPVKPEAHARFDALSRSYIYRIHQQKNPFLRQLSYYFSPAVDLSSMNQAAAQLVAKGPCDYGSFSKARSSQPTHICTIKRAQWEYLSPDSLAFHITADRFLRGMVRALVGTLLEIGTGRLDPDDFAQIIDSRNRSRAGRAVPPEGLYLSEIVYPEDIFL
ncbi:MAG: tRNA pseudouridine(38-40) synthase TruA [Cyclobacteriaceae bacterium]